MAQIKPIEYREADFRRLVFEFKGYSNPMLQEFFEYWIERNPSGKKMRWEMEKTWSLNLRLNRWARTTKVKDAQVRKAKKRWSDFFNDFLVAYRDGADGAVPIDEWVRSYDLLKEQGLMQLRKEQWAELKKNYGHNIESGKKEAVKLLFNRMIIAGDTFAEK